MSKASNKLKQGYDPKPIQRTCSNCAHFRSESVIELYGYKSEKNLHCFIGGFAVKKNGNCRFHEFKIEPNLNNE